MTNPEAARLRISPRRRIVFTCLMLLMVYIAAELICVVVMSFMNLGPLQSRLRSIQTDIASGSGVSGAANEPIHPYLGWIHNPQTSPIEKWNGYEIPVNGLGFKDNGHSIYTRSDDLFIVGIAGGSVAFQFSWAAEELLKERLQGHPRVRGRRIQFVRMALSGYKQPQQLMAYNFLMSLGAEFDLIVNIDGFNETTLAILENAELDTAIVYPRSWHARSISMLDPRDSADAAQLLHLKGKRQEMAKDILASNFQWSPLLNLVWYTRDQTAAGRLVDLGLSISKNRRSSFVNHGPENAHDGTLLEEDVVAIWMRCSRQMHQLCRANGTLYLHVLQPNQYVPGSKPLSEFELKKCIDPQGQTRAVVMNLFPQLQKKSEELRKYGVAFSDQTQVFSGVSETLYVDPWCHFNTEGNRILGEAISVVLLDMLDHAEGERSPTIASDGRNSQKKRPDEDADTGPVSANGEK